MESKSALHCLFLSTASYKKKNIHNRAVTRTATAIPPAQGPAPPSYSKRRKSMKHYSFRYLRREQIRTDILTEYHQIKPMPPALPSAKAQPQTIPSDEKRIDGN